MGSSTKKHKRDKDSKKRKHRSRSRSPTSPASDGRDKERRHHKKRKDRKRERSPEVEEVPVDSHLLSPSPEKRRRLSDEEVETPATSASRTDSLSIEESNRLRAKLGLKPLQVTEQSIADDGKLKDDLGEFYHKPADNIAEKKKREKIRTKIAERKEKRSVEQKLLGAKGLGESDDEESDTSAWVARNRQITKQKEEAAKRAAILDEMDKEFGVSEIVAEEERGDRVAAYGISSLCGLRVAHDEKHFTEGRSVVLTLQDTDVLDEADDVLVNVNLLDDHRYDKSNENKKKAKAGGYDPYEGADDPELYGVAPSKNLLSKYDEEIFGEKRPQGFIIGDTDQDEARKFKQMMIKEKLSSKRLESLVLPELKIASDYYTEDEIKAKFKKPKKKGKMRKKMKMEEYGEDTDNVRGDLITDDTGIKQEDLSSIKMEEEEEEDTELEAALAKARRLKLADQYKRTLPKLEDLLKREPKEERDDQGEEQTEEESGIVLDSTAEFCRTLGDIPTYGQAGNRDVDAADLLELERAASEAASLACGTEGAWSTVDVDTEQTVDLTREGGGALAAEPVLGAGVGGALRLALSKGYLEGGREARAAPPALPHLKAINYSIDDKAHAHGDDDKLNRRERGGYSGPASDFREKEGFRPNVKLDYVDDEGRPLRPKEAFRYLSHKFHGKGPGKNKQEKRIKQNHQEGLMKKMNSTDTPLGTLALLQARQKEARAAFVVLSGAKQPRNSAL